MTTTTTITSTTTAIESESSLERASEEKRMSTSASASASDDLGKPGELQSQQSMSLEYERTQSDFKPTEGVETSNPSYYSYMRKTIKKKEHSKKESLLREHRVEMPLSERMAANYRKAAANVHRFVPSVESYMARSQLSEKADPAKSNAHSKSDLNLNAALKSRSRSKSKSRSNQKSNPTRPPSPPTASTLATTEPPPTVREFTFSGYDILTDTGMSPDGNRFGYGTGATGSGNGANGAGNGNGAYASSGSLQDLEFAQVSVSSRVKEDLQNLFLKACQQFKVLPSQHVLDNITEKQLVLRGRNIGDDGAKAICVTLLSNATIEKLDFGECSIRDPGAFAIADLLNENTYITELCLSRNIFSADGLRSLCDALRNHRQLITLDFSGLHLRDAESTILEDMIANNSSIRKLYLSNNDLSVDGGMALGRALLLNDTLEELDLSWNHLRGAGAVAIANSLRRNIGLRMLDVSMNGFGEEGCVALAEALPFNSSLEQLNLTQNRIAERALTALVIGVMRNDSLTQLNLSANPITPSAALSFVRSLHKAPGSCALRRVDLRDVTVDRELRSLAEQIALERAIVIECGPMIRKAFDKRYDVTPLLMQADAVKALVAYMKKLNLRASEMFQAFCAADAASEGITSRELITRDNFISGLRLLKMPLTNHQVDELMRQLDTDGDGQVSMADLMSLVKTQQRREHELRQSRKIVD